MKKNKKSRIFSRVLHRLTWANVYRARGGNDNAYKEVLAAKRLLEGIGCENVKVAFYDREFHIGFEVYHAGRERNRYYTASASHGYSNDYHCTNKTHVNHLITSAEFVRECTLRRDYSDYQMFRQYVDNTLYWILTADEYDDYCLNGNINAIPYDVSIRLWRELRQCAESVVDEAIAYKKVVL